MLTGAEAADPDAVPTSPATPRQPWRLAAWCMLVGLLATAAYAARLSTGDTPDDLLYRWSTAIGALLQYGVMAALVLAIAHGPDRMLLALRVPSGLRRTAGLSVVALLVIFGASAALSIFLDAAGEQGLVPASWDSSRALPFVANALVVIIAAPVVEESLYRGLGMGLLMPYVGPAVAILLTGLVFGLAHGLVLGLPVLTVFGVTLGVLRWRTGSVYPGMAVHATFNALALVAAVVM